MPLRLPCAIVQPSVIGPVTWPLEIFVIDTFTVSEPDALSVMVCHSCGESVTAPGLLAP